jgi:hypothetical protein
MWIDSRACGIEDTMLHWPSKSNQKTDELVQADIERARAVLPSLRLKLDKGGAAVARDYGEGVVEVAQGLARALGVGVDVAQAGHPLRPEQLVAAVADLAASEERCREHLGGRSRAGRALAARLLFACQIFAHLYRLRLHAHSVPEDRREEVEGLAETYVSLTRVLAEIGAKPAR